MLPFLVGCEEYLKGEEKILGTATINGQNYKKSPLYGLGIFKDILHVLNFMKTISCFIMRLSPEKLVIKGEFETKTAINELTY